MATSTSPSGVSSHPWRITISVIAGLVLALPALLPSSASADTLTSARAKAAQISAQLNQINARFEQLDEQYNTATINLKRADANIKTAEQQLAQTKKHLADDSRQLRSYAVSEYMDGSDTPALEAVLTSQGDSATERKGYLDAAAGNRQDLIDKLGATQQQADSQLAALHTARTKAAQIADQLSNATSQERAALSQEQHLNAQATGEVATLLHQQQAAQAAAEQRLAQQAQAAAVHVSARSAAPTNVGSSGGDIAVPPPSQVFVPPAGSGATVAVAAAESQIGVPYVWAGASPSVGFDCSGLTMWAWGQGGVSLPHSAQGQYDMSTHISESQLEPGDLVFFGTSSGSIGHVGMYVGGGTMVHAPHTGATVTYQSIGYWPGEGMYFGRV